MNKGEMCEMLLRQAREFRSAGIQNALDRNQHMHDFRGVVDLEMADALIVGLLNHFGGEQGLDFGVNISDLEGERHGWRFQTIHEMH